MLYLNWKNKMKDMHYLNDSLWKKLRHLAKKELKRTVFSYCDFSSEIIFDIGANVGAYSLNMAIKYKNAKIYSFEPVPHNFDNLKKNMETNNCKNVNVFNFGFYEEKKIIELGIPKEDSKSKRENETYRIFNKAGLVDKVECRFEVLDDFILREKIKKIDILKIDTEGAERYIFKKGLNALSITKMMYVEILEENADLIDFFKSLNFRLIKIRRSNFLFMKENEND